MLESSHFNSRKLTTVLLAFVAVVIPSCQATGPLAPSQPESGPGGKEYTHAKVIAERVGSGNEEIWIFTPSEPAAENAPTVVFMHGWGAMSPWWYGAWIRHLVRRGNVVLYPRYQENVLVDTAVMEPAATAAILAAIDHLAENYAGQSDTTTLAYATHSLGGIISANLVATSEERGLPPASVLFTTHPGGEEYLDLGPLGGIPSDTLVVAIAGAEDSRVGTETAEAIASQPEQVPAENRNLIILRSERRARFDLLADHFAPLAVDVSITRNRPEGEADEGVSFVWQNRRERRRPDAFDYFAFWKVFDGLLDAAYRGTNREYALGSAEALTNMGELSDGTAVTPLRVVTLR